MYCYNCGKQIQDNSRYCKFCGTMIQREPDQLLDRGDNMENVRASQNYGYGNFIVLLTVVMLMVVGLCYLLPIVKSETRLEVQEYNIFSFTQDVIYDKYTFNYPVEQGQAEWDNGVWNANGEVVSVFEYMHGKSLEMGNAGYTEFVYKSSLTLYWIALVMMGINIVLIGYSIIRVTRGDTLLEEIIQQMLFLEIARSVIIIGLIKSIVKGVPEIFAQYDYWFGEMETANITVYPFYLVPLILMILLLIINKIYSKEK